MNSKWKVWLRDLSLQLTIAVAALMILAFLGWFQRELATPVQIPTWLLAAVALLIVLMLGFAVYEQYRRERRQPPPFVLPTKPEEGNEAYILLKVAPKQSETIAKRLSTLGQVSLAAAVWGQWDIILHVATGDARQLIAFLEYLQEVEGVKRTETLIVRHDQKLRHSQSQGIPGPRAFLLLTLAPQHIRQVLKLIEDHIDSPQPPTNGTAIEDAAGTLGPYDIALTVRYQGELDLRNLVMDYIQESLVGETITMPAIRSMVYKNGSAIG